MPLRGAAAAPRPSLRAVLRDLRRSMAADDPILCDCDDETALALDECA